MLDQELRARAAGIVRAHASLLSCSPGSEPGVIAETRSLADALEAEPAREVELAEALRDLRHVASGLMPWAVGEAENGNATAEAEVNAAAPVLRRAREVLEGVERTHALVPVPREALNRLADVATWHAAEHNSPDASLVDVASVPADEAFSLAESARAAARGERVEWPTA
jgi:hypothetical protein